MPIDGKSKDTLVNSLHKSIEGVFFSSFKIGINHVILTWLFFNIYGIEFDFIISFLAGFLSIIPLLSPYMIMIPVSI